MRGVKYLRKGRVEMEEIKKEIRDSAGGKNTTETQKPKEKK